MVRFRQSSVWLAVLAAVLAWSFTATSTATAATALDQASALLTSTLNAYQGPDGPYSNGVWLSENDACWACNTGGPATAAAALYKTATADPAFLQEAEQTIDTAIASHQLSDGSFSPAPGDTQSADIRTMFFGVELGTSLHELRDTLDPDRLARWTAALRHAADFLINNGNVTWYSNGNINLGNSELFFLTWLATGDGKYLQAYEQSWTTAMTPPQGKFPGAGLIVTKPPTRPDGSDGAGYLAEIGAGGTGFDAEYSELQLDVASRLFLLSGDTRALRLSNLLINTLLPRVDGNMMLDTSGGTRHPEANRKVDFLTSAFAVLGLHGGRSDLVPMISEELNAEIKAYAQPWQAYNPVFRRALGNDVATTAIALATAPSVTTTTPLSAGFSSAPTSRPATQPPATATPKVERPPVLSSDRKRSAADRSRTKTNRERASSRRARRVSKKPKKHARITKKHAPASARRARHRREPARR